MTPHWYPEKVDHLEPIGDVEAIEMTTRLATEEGVFAGISTGANVVGPPLGRAPRPAVDTGFKYKSVAPYAE